MKLRIRRLSPDAIIPSYAHPGDAGLDLHACEDVALDPGATCLVQTGVAIELPEATEAQVRPRSGLALKHSVTVLNTPGTIDEGYRGEIGVVLINHGSSTFQVTRGMRIAQLVIQKRWTVEVVEVDGLTDTTRGAGGFGSTGS
jgi:dUTP pyrophosphatase